MVIWSVITTEHLSVCLLEGSKALSRDQPPQPALFANADVYQRLWYFAFPVILKILHILPHALSCIISRFVVVVVVTAAAASAVVTKWEVISCWLCTAWLSLLTLCIVTFYGNTGNSCFQGFFNFPEMQVIAKHFCIYHLSALGQHERAQTLPNG